METIQSIINTVMSSIYLMSMCGIGLLLLVMLFTFNFDRIYHFFVSSLIVIEPYEKGKKLIRFKREESEFDYIPKKVIKNSTHLCQNCGSPQKV